MRLVSTLTGASLTGLMLAMSVPASAAVDAKLLDMLRANGSISPAQYTELSAELAKDTQAKQQADAAQAQALADVKAKKDELSSFEQKVAWAAKTQVKGDVRFRQEMVNVDDPAASNVDGDRTADRQRIRARVGFYSQINPEVDTGIRIATGSSNDRRSTNENLDTAFAKKSLWLDMGYIDWHPAALPNLHLIGGKMAQPWVSMGDVIWDSDINPEGVAATYKLPLGGGTELFGSTGYYTLKDNIDSDGYQFKHDLSMYTAQGGAKFALGDQVGVTVGASYYGFRNDDNDEANATRILAVNGNTATEFKLYEGFGQVDLKMLPVPLSLYGQYVKNADASTDGDQAWLAGIKSKLGAFSVDYNYRDVQRNAVVGAFTDSDFANGYTASRGHKIKLGYDISKNFGLGVTYFLAQTDGLPAGTSTKTNDVDVKTLQLDLEAKF
ncbi:putative porin [Pseudomonas sp. NPDC007930]|uniref:putative porin n=1 Tax=Pseudomonas sp. NPDC007930 TaxID=3364417 RepID=UPI0036ED080A